MKASEVFDLPVAAGVEDYDEDDLMGANGDGLWYASFITPEQAQIAANCINHADALADALDKAISLLSQSTSVRVASEVELLEVLNAYRGAK